MYCFTLLVQLVACSLSDVSPDAGMDGLLHPSNGRVQEFGLARRSNVTMADPTL